MMVAGKDVEMCGRALAQKARAAGIHLMLATQRPSWTSSPGVIKNNFPTRMSFRVASRHRLRTILDCNGAESLLGMGDMLWLPPGVSAAAARPRRVRLRGGSAARSWSSGRPRASRYYDESILQAARGRDGDDGDGSRRASDEMYDEAVRIVCRDGRARLDLRAPAPPLASATTAPPA
jgi:S-DNA-T family DNA segregation ATPase FtsK/SpoIIIE